MRTKVFLNHGGGNSTLPTYAAPEVLLHEFNVENGFAASEGDLDGSTSDSWYKDNEEIL